MRDILTVLASLVILALAAALIAPPLVDWENHRDWIDQAISRASGADARTQGGVGVRLLPSPRLTLDTLRLGGGQHDSPSLDASAVTAEVALTPLLRGEVRFTEARAGRANIRVPIDGAWRLPHELAGSGREWAIENLKVDQLLVTTVVTATGRTDQLAAESVTIEGQKLSGPWRVEGLTAGMPFRLITGELGPDQTLQVKLSGGGDRDPRFEIDARLGLPTAQGEIPTAAGTAKLWFAAPGEAAAAAFPIALALQTQFKADSRVVELDELSLEGGDAGASVRLTGSGAIRLDDPRISLKLEGRRVDADSLIPVLGTPDLWPRLKSSLPPSTIPLDLALSLSSIALAQEELTDVSLRGSLENGRVRVEQLSFTAPGDTRVALSGEAGLAPMGGANGRFSVTSGASDRLAGYLERLEIRSPLLRVLDGRPIEATADFALSAPVASFRNGRFRAGDAILTGNGRYTAPEGSARGKLEVQLAAQGVDLEQLPQTSNLFAATEHLDVGLTFDARDVRYGGGRSAGRITTRILSEGPALVVDTLEITDLAGANARVNGRIFPDGTGRITGKVTARRAAPLVDLIGAVWIGGVSRLVPNFLREGPLDLDIISERAPSSPNASDVRLRTTVRGTAAGGRFEGEAFSTDGLTENLSVRIATDNTGRWIGQPNLAALRRPSSLDIRGVRVGSGQFQFRLVGELAGLRIDTIRPFALDGREDVVDSGEARLASGDLTPFLALLGEAAGAEGAVPVDVRIGIGRERNESQLAISGRVANEGLDARFALRSRSDISGTVTLERLSMPWLVTALALNDPAEARPAGPWSRARFGQFARPVTAGQAVFRVRRLGLGRGLAAEDASFTLAIAADGLSLREFEGRFAGGRLSGGMTVTRLGGQASIAGEGTLRHAALAALAGPTPLEAGLSGTLRFGGTADTFAGLIANLGGTGEIEVTGLQAPQGDPGALARALPRLLAEDDPLAVRRLDAVVNEELNRASIRSAAVGASAVMVGGVLRLSPFVADAGPAVWQGVVAFDAKTLALEARGTLTARGSVRGWTGTAPFIGLAWRGPLRNPIREVDTGPLTNGLAGIVLQRELERVEAFEVEGNERQRRGNRREHDHQRELDRVAAEEAAAHQARLLEEAERRGAEERARVQAERAAAEEPARLETERRAAEALQRREAERVAAQERARVEAERVAAEQRARVEAERVAVEQRAQVEAERRAAEERARLEAERRAAEARERSAAERLAAEEALRQERLRQEAERQAAEAARLERLRLDEAARQERLREQEQLRQEAQRAAQERALAERARLEAERRAAEERVRAEAQRRAIEASERVEAERRAAEAKERAEAERRAAEARERAEGERRAAEARERALAERRAAEEALRRDFLRQEAERQQEAARQERLREEERQRQEAARQAAEERARVEVERARADAEERTRMEVERRAAEARAEAERRAAAEEALRQERARGEEAARQERLREQERVRAAEQRALIAAPQQPSALLPLPPPIVIPPPPIVFPPPPLIQGRPGGVI